jgi:hypothetical protein
MDNPEIKYIRHDAINFEKWDRCLESAPNRRVYAFSWFLDIVADNWDAIVADDYTFVMPLPSRKKFGIRYVYPPVYCQQLGVFPVPPESIHLALAACLKKHFQYISYQINSSDSSEFYEGFSITTKTNLVLNLNKSYEILSAQYSTHARRNINTAAKAGVRVEKGLAPAEFIKAKKTADKLSADNYVSLEKLLEYVSAKNKGQVYAAWSAENNLLAAALILADSNRFYYLNAFSTEEGKKLRAMYAIVDRFISDYSGRDIILDFEGSVLDGLARFYSGFGAENEPYFLIQRNQLPFAGIIKKIQRKK